MTTYESRPNTIPWPPMIYILAIVIAVALGWFLPLPWIGAPLGDILFAIGWLLVAGALAIDVAAMRTMRRHKTTIMPHKGSQHLVTDGPFAFTRNPIYLANTMLTIGIGLIVGNAWFLPAAIAAAFATTYLAIRREEQHLTARFGKRYRDYCKKARRWI